MAPKEDEGTADSQERRSGPCTVTPNLSIHTTTYRKATSARIQFLGRVTRGLKQKVL